MNAPPGVIAEALGGRLHRENGPAVLLPSGEAHYFNEGTEVARNAIS
jgi:hypothetical protein